MLRSFYLSLFVLSISCSIALSGGPENAIVVINSQSASSKLIGNFYVHKRRIPPTNVIYLDDVPNNEVIKLDDFKEKILKPLLLEIDARKLSQQIDYVIYSADFPSKVDGSSLRKEMEQSKNSLYRNIAKSKTSFPDLSLNSATYYYQGILSDRHEAYLNLSSNYYYRGKTQSLLTRPFAGKDQVSFLKATRLARSKDFDGAIATMNEIAKKHPFQVAIHYWLSRIHAQNGDVDAASQSMQRAILAGWQYQEYTLQDPAFSGLVNNEPFQDVLKSIPEFSFHQLASQSFHSQFNWSYNGSINGLPEEGRRYMLSTMLAVTRNKGTSEKQALNYLERSIESDGSKPHGTFYFTKTSDVRSKTRLPNFEGAMAELKQLGYASEIIVGKLPTNRFDVLGLMTGTNKFAWKPSGSQILPGAICDNLTSFGGWLESNIGQTKLSMFLKHGAAGASGTVREPYAIQAKFPHPRLHVHYARGCTLAESFYQSVHGPFQLLIVGDALCKPFAQIPTIRISGEIVKGEPIQGNVQILADTINSEIEISHTEIFVDGYRKAAVEKFSTKPFTIDTTSLSDGYHEIRFVPVAVGTVAPKGLVIIPISVNNHGHSVQLTSESSDVSINGTATFQFDAPEADAVQLIHNSRVLAKSDQTKGQFKIKAFDLGRGTVSLRAVASVDGNLVSSTPFLLNVKGPISTKIPKFKAPPRPKPKKPKSPKAPVKNPKAQKAKAK